MKLKETFQIKLEQGSLLVVFVLLAVSGPFANQTLAKEPLTAKDLLNMKRVTSAKISPGGEWIAYTLHVPRQTSEKPGRAYSELYLISIKTKEIRPYIVGKQRVTSTAWRPDGQAIGFLLKRGSKTQVWMIPVSGGEARQVTFSDTDVSGFRWHPEKNKIAYMATTPRTDRESILKERGYDFTFYEENLTDRNLYIIDVDESKTEQLTEGITVWSFEFSPDGKTIALAASNKNLVDQRYMDQRIHLLDVERKSMNQLTNNPGKLGNYAFSPDGAHLAYVAAIERKDHKESQVYVISSIGGEARNLTISSFRGHANWVGWEDNKTVLYRAGEGIFTTLSTVKISGGKRKVVLNSQNSGIVFTPPSRTDDLRHIAFVGQSPEVPGDAYYWTPGENMERLTDVNPWLAERELGMQEAIRYAARDGLEIEGLLIYPVDYEKGKQFPLVVIVHGGPESHYSNGWLTSYSRPGQVLAGKGYAAFYPNYRASTGYGTEFAAEGYGDPAGTEFDDIADGIEYLVSKGIADRNRVGLGGGSYGGYASGWFATYYTKYVKAVCMFVGISDVIGKRGTTDIPYEMLYVHYGKKLEEMWDLSLKRSPIYWAHQSNTATLIYGGTDDTRVHPSQSMELYRRMKMNNHPAVRLVQYPGEKHGNAKQPGRIDVLYRILDWYDWYVKDAKPLNGPMPPLDISHKYGLELPTRSEDKTTSPTTHSK
jgi:dipeptidyl aminopeptidase/acylaminoacyl peptidase